MPATMNMSSAVATRNSLSRKQQQDIKALYTDAARNVAKRAEDYRVRMPGAVLKQQYLSDIANSLSNNINDITRRIEASTMSAAEKAAAAVVSDANAWAGKLGFETAKAYAHVSKEVVESLVSGKVYKEGRNLSAALWGDNKKTIRDIYAVVERGAAENKSVYDIAKALEQYVMPGQSKPWDWSKVYPGSKKVVDYNAQRLARTLIQHAYQKAFVQTTKKNPFVEAYVWNSAFAGRTCQLCKDMDGQVFAKNELPYDHPNGLCVVTAEISKSFEEIGSEIADWYNAPAGTYPQMDSWINSMYE